MIKTLLLLATLYVPSGLPAAKPPGSIYDGAHLLNPAETAQVEEEIAAEANAGVEVAVVTFSDTDGNGPRPIAHEIQSAWNLSPKSVVYLITLKPKFIWIQPGEAFTDNINSGDSERIARTEMAPRFKQAAFGAGLLAGMREVKAMVTHNNPTPVEAVPLTYTPAATQSVQPVPAEHASHLGLWFLLAVFGTVGGYFLIEKIREYRRRRLMDGFPAGENVTSVPTFNRPAEDLTPLRALEPKSTYSVPKPLDPYVPPAPVTNIDSNNFNLAVVDLGSPSPAPAPAPAPKPVTLSEAYEKARPASVYDFKPAEAPKRRDTPAPSYTPSSSKSSSSDSGGGSSWGGFSNDSGGGSSWSDSGGGSDFGGGGFGGDSGGGSGW